MYRLVGRIEDYPQFVPGCVSARIEDESGERRLARLGFKVRGLSDSFATENHHENGNRIRMRLVDGPFRELSGHWEFLPLSEQACKVSLQLSLDFGNRMLEATLSPWVDRAVSQVMDAFRLRAQVLYGKD